MTACPPSTPSRINQSQTKKEGEIGIGGGLLELWRRTDLRNRTFVSATAWASYGFCYYGVIAFSAVVLGEVDDGTCSFNYPILFFSASSEVVVNLVSVLYIDRVDLRLNLAVTLCVCAVAIVLLPVSQDEAWLLVMTFLARGAAYTTGLLCWVIT